LFASHPPSAERVANNRTLVTDLRAEGFADGEFGADAYQAALRPLRRDLAAYEAYDEARAALADDRRADALELVEQAIEAQGGEAAFHGLRGDVRLTDKRFEDAEINYDRAIERDDQYFAYYLGRGVARARQGEREAAEQDLNRSLQLLPSATAYAELGRLAESAGDVDTAVRYYLTAGESESVAGRSARSAGLRLDVPRHPERYIETLLSRDSAGRLVLQVSNRTPVPLARVVVQVELLDRSGQVRRVQRSVAELDAGAARLLLVMEDTQSLADARATVAAADVRR
jgi:tetratricopeptide (TPR) repeat protein